MVVAWGIRDQSARNKPMLAVNEDNFDNLVLQCPKPILVYFGAPWCGLCHFVKPLLNRLHGEWGEQLVCVEVNADVNLHLANAYRLKNLPTLILFNRGQVIQRLEDFRVREDLHRIREQIAVSLFSS
ncbi:thioredoxin family protein [Synechocystis sp. CS-94]|nr:thioredoxin family protein [Synechocystis sp. CS-94]